MRSSTPGRGSSAPTSGRSRVARVAAEVRVLSVAGPRRARLAGLGLDPRARRWIRPRTRSSTRSSSWRPIEPEPSGRVVVVEIDDCSIEHFRALGEGGWPWSRQRHADLLDQLDRAGVRAVGYDVLFPEASHAGSGRRRHARSDGRRRQRSLRVRLLARAFGFRRRTPARRRWRRRPVRFTLAPRCAGQVRASRCCCPTARRWRRTARCSTSRRGSDGVHPRHAAARAVRRLGVAVAAAAAGVDRDRTRTGDVSRLPCASTGASIRDCRRSAPPT